MAREASRSHGEAAGFPIRLDNGCIVRIRAIGMGDVQREHAFLDRLSPEARSFRFLGLVRDASEQAARDLTSVDGAREVVLGAFSGEDDDAIEVGVARYLASRDGRHCDCTVTVDPAWQKVGVGSALMQRLIEIARRRGIRRMYAVDAARCAGAHSLAERLGFHARPDPEDPAATTFELVLE